MARWPAQIDYWIIAVHWSQSKWRWSWKAYYIQSIVMFGQPIPKLFDNIYICHYKQLSPRISSRRPQRRSRSHWVPGEEKIWTPGFRKLFCLRPRYTFSTLVLLSCNLCVTLLLTGASWCHFLEWVADMQLIATTPQKGPYIGVCSSSNSFFLLQ